MSQSSKFTADHLSYITLPNPYTRHTLPAQPFARHASLKLRAHHHVGGGGAATEAVGIVQQAQLTDAVREGGGGCRVQGDDRVTREQTGNTDTHAPAWLTGPSSPCPRTQRVSSGL